MTCFSRNIFDFYVTKRKPFELRRSKGWVFFNKGYHNGYDYNVPMA